MTDEPTSTAAPGREEALAGLRLADARRSRKLSLTEIANELHLDPHKVTALEQNRFSEIGAPVFVKGYLRKYAEIVGIAPEPVLADYRRLEQRAEEPPIVGLRRRPPRDFPVGALLTALLVAGIAAVGLWLWRSGTLDRVLPDLVPAEPAPVAAEPEAAAPGDESAGPLADSASAGAAAGTPTDEAQPAAGGMPAEDPAAEAAPEPVLAAPESMPAPAGQVALDLTFTADCWTEVSDAAGDRLFFGLGRAGETVSVTGSAPLHVLLGNYAGVTLAVDGEPYAIPASALRGETARLTIAESSP